MWNTGLALLRNATPSTLFIVDQEDTFYSAVVPAGQIVGLNGVIFPWCSNSMEVFQKAFRVHRGSNRSGPLILWMFQYYWDNTVYFISGSTVLWNARMTIGEGPSSYLNVLIQADERPRAVAVRDGQGSRPDLRRPDVDMAAAIERGIEFSMEEYGEQAPAYAGSD